MTTPGLLQPRQSFPFPLSSGSAKPLHLISLSRQSFTGSSPPCTTLLEQTGASTSILVLYDTENFCLLNFRETLTDWVPALKSVFLLAGCVFPS